MDRQTKEILAELSSGRIPDYISENGDYAAELLALRDYHLGILSFAAAIARGDLSATLAVSGGQLVGSLKALHASLRHLTWQTKQIARGDLTQRVDFMGEFSSAFNSMVENLAEARQELIHMGTHDIMTGLHNRAYFDAERERVTKGRSYPVTFIMADLDGLKTVNDTRGHEAGDLLIRAAADILRSSFRGDDVVARIGGDEFAAIMTLCAPDAGETALERIRRNLAEYNRTSQAAVSVSLGIGTAACSEQLDQAYKTADERMYANKALNKSQR